MLEFILDNMYGIMGFVMFLVMGILIYLFKDALLAIGLKVFDLTIADWYYNKSWKSQRIIANTFFTIGYTILIGGLIFMIMYFA